MIVQGDPRESRRDEGVGVDTLARDAVVERNDRPSGGERTDLVAVGVEDLRRLARGDSREELLPVEVSFDEVDLHVAESIFGEVDARSRDLIDAREPHHRQ
ncbi:hypothetical protein GCM10009724_18830 [Microbacterium lacticum]|nr:hypothetical protein MLA01_18950 [Microbacterium lacticum]GGI67935.1 hypothetical protein GCM10009724_18830 [Microbacterium lacticum]